MSKITWKGSALLAPVPPVLITSRFNGQDNVATVAWCGILCTHPPMTYISLRPERLSNKMIRSSGSFCINVPTSYMAKEVDYCGTYSGRDKDKFENCGFTKAECEISTAP